VLVVYALAMSVGGVEGTSTAPLAAKVEPFASRAPAWQAAARVAHFEGATLSEVDGGSASEGSLRATGDRAYDGRRAARAEYNGANANANAFARVWYDVDWETGTEVWYGAAFFIPSKKALPCWSTIARWDNYSLFESAGETGGIEVLENGRADVFLSNYGADHVSLTPSFDSRRTAGSPSRSISCSVSSAGRP